MQFTVNPLETNMLLSTAQFGFRFTKNTEETVATVSSYVYNSSKTKQKCVYVCLALVKAFRAMLLQTF